jgi:hypothetical protein
LDWSIITLEILLAAVSIASFETQKTVFLHTQCVYVVLFTFRRSRKIA